MHAIHEANAAAHKSTTRIAFYQAGIRIPAVLQIQPAVSYVGVLLKVVRRVLQFEWADYEADMASLATMAREEVVAMLKRNSTGFSRCAGACLISANILHCQHALPIQNALPSYNPVA